MACAQNPSFDSFLLRQCDKGRDQGLRLLGRALEAKSRSDLLINCALLKTDWDFTRSNRTIIGSAELRWGSPI